MAGLINHKLKDIVLALIYTHVNWAWDWVGGVVMLYQAQPHSHCTNKKSYFVWNIGTINDENLEIRETATINIA